MVISRFCNLRMLHNTADLGDLLSVITVGATGITVNDLTRTGDLDITGVFSAATGLFNYLSANNADFEDDDC